MKRLHKFLLYIIFICLSFPIVAQTDNFPVNKYSSAGFEKHKQSTKGFMLSIGYALGTQFLNPVFVDSKQAGQLKSEGGFSLNGELPIFYPISLQVGVYSETFKPSDNLIFGNLQGSQVKIDNEYIEAFICSQLLPSKSIFLPYIGVGYLDGGLKLKMRDDKKSDVLAAVKMQSTAWKIGLRINLINSGTQGKIGIMIDYMQPFQIDGLLTNTFYAFNRFQAGAFIKFQ